MSMKIKLRLLQRRGYDTVCWWCGTRFSLEDLTLDHLYPKSKGGNSSFENLRLSCRSCNSTRSDSLYPPSQFWHSIDKNLGCSKDALEVQRKVLHIPIT